MFSTVSLSTKLVVVATSLAAGLGVLVWIASGVFGLAAAAAVFAAATLFELIRMALERRRAQHAKLWPQVFDSCYSAQASGVLLENQVRDLALEGPGPIRHQFAALSGDLEEMSVTDALKRFQKRCASREADLFAMLLALNHELGGRGQRAAWRDAGRHLRESLKLSGEISTKQGWITGSAKMALFAPWLIAVVLMNLGDNRAAFASASGTGVLLAGLGLSALGYFLVNVLGRLPQQPRVLYAS
jgi:tight adherence protein B